MSRTPVPVRKDYPRNSPMSGISGIPGIGRSPGEDMRASEEVANLGRGLSSEDSEFGDTVGELKATPPSRGVSLCLTCKPDGCRRNKTALDDERQGGEAAVKERGEA
eukprot:1361489-Rhodomonas_salina.5